MDECNSIGHNVHETPNMYRNLTVNASNDQQFRLNKINEIIDYFIAEIRERELMSKNLSKYIASFEYFDKSLIVFVSSNWQHLYCIICNYNWSTSRNYKCKLYSCIFNYNRICKKLLKQQEIIRKNNKIVMLARSKLNSIESKISKALINNEIVHEDFIAILNEEKKRNW